MTETKAEDTQRAKPMPIVVHAQYIKDLSFENPHSPEALRAGQAPPDMDVSISMNARRLEDDKIQNLYEVILSLGATAKRGESTVFIAEIHYAATVSLNGVPEGQHHPMLLIEVPKVTFPFVRQILCDLTQGGGYPPLLLQPVDFRTLYVEQFADQIEGAKAS